MTELAKHPYYIHTPRYTRTSGGIRTLHFLCHHLNSMGCEAHVAICYSDDQPDTRADLDCPILTEEIIARHRRQGIVPIVIYPEVVYGNPLGGSCVVRYLLNYAGLLGGDSRFAEEELVVAFSADIAKAYGDGTPILHMPTIDTTVYHEAAPVPRSGFVYYAFKLENVHGEKPFDVPEGAVEITRDRPDSQEPHEIADLFRRSEAFYCYENTALATEAVLCGCPVILMPNRYFDRSIATEELGWDGYAWGDKPDEVARARATVRQGQENYHRTVREMQAHLVDFVALTQARAETAGPAEVKLPVREIGAFPRSAKINIGAIIRYVVKAPDMRPRDGWRMIWAGLRVIFRLRRGSASL